MIRSGVDVFHTNTKMKKKSNGSETNTKTKKSGCTILLINEIHSSIYDWCYVSFGELSKKQKLKRVR